MCNSYASRTRRGHARGWRLDGWMAWRQSGQVVWSLGGNVDWKLCCWVNKSSRTKNRWHIGAFLTRTSLDYQTQCTRNHGSHRQSRTLTMMVLEMLADRNRSVGDWWMDGYWRQSMGINYHQSSISSSSIILILCLTFHQPSIISHQSSTINHPSHQSSTINLQSSIINP